MRDYNEVEELLDDTFSNIIYYNSEDDIYLKTQKSHILKGRSYFVPLSSLPMYNEGSGLRGMNSAVRSTIGCEVWLEISNISDTRDNGARAECCASCSLEPIT